MIENDTIIAITENQLRKINNYLLEYESLQLYNDSIFSELSIQQLNYNRQIEINSLLNKKNRELLVNYSDLQKLNNTNQKLIDYYKLELKVKNRQKTFAFFGGALIGVAATSILILIF